MRAVSVPPDPVVEEVTGPSVDWQYSARVVVPTAQADSQAWARACFERSPVAMRGFLVVGWMLLLLEGWPRSDGSHILGWPITPNAEGTVLQRRSRLGLHATLVFTVRGESVTFSSAMSFTRLIARVAWMGVAPVHRWAVRVLLTRAARTMSR
jgi:hypothetical protein